MAAAGQLTRYLSWLFSASAVLAPLLYADYQVQQHHALHNAPVHEASCGMSSLGVALGAAAMAWVCAWLAASAAWMHFARQPKPRTQVQRIELWLLSLPLILILLVISAGALFG